MPATLPSYQAVNVAALMGNAAEELTDTSVSASNSASPETAALHARARRAERLAAHQAVLVAMLAELLASHSLESALDALAASMKSRFDCHRVAIALDVEGELELSAVSQQAVLDTSSSEARLLVDAMNEACAQESILCWPPLQEDLGMLLAHRALAGRRLSGSICSVPMYDKQERVGAFLLERRDQRGFPVSMLKRLSVALGPMLTLHRKADRGWWAVFRHSLSRMLELYLGRERPGARLLSIVAAVLLLGSCLVTTNWQIVAPAELLSHERRLITAPLNGFVADIQIVAGDKVTQGQVLAELDRRELELELASRESEVTVAEAEFRAAMASHDRQTTGISRARLAQARARHDGVKQRLDRTQLVSPIDGLVIAADATRTSGMAVSRGEVLFEIAPSADFEVHALVDEADVYDVSVGQTGTLSVRSRPGEGLPVIVESVYPVAEAKAGQNRFRVRASLVAPADSLNPGQTGVVRLDAGKMSVMGAMTRRLNRRIAELWWRWIG